jgi:hypothetical protein
MRNLLIKLDIAVTNAVRRYQNRDMWPLVKPPKPKSGITWVDVVALVVFVGLCAVFILR